MTPLRKKTPLLLAGLLPGLALLLAAAGCSRKEAAPAAPAAPVRVQLVQEASGNTGGWIAATLGATRRATLSTRMAASVRKVHVQEGQRVAQGTLLVSLEDGDLQGALRAAEAAVAAAAAQHRRIENLARQNAAIPAEQDQARTQLAQAEAALAQVKANLANTRIRAPFAGVVQARRVNDGDFAGPGTPLVELEGQGELELVGSVSESEAQGLRIGLRLPFESEGIQGMAEITALATGGDAISHRGTLRARVLKGGPSFRTGSFARIKVPESRKAVKSEEEITIPRSALVERGELRGVFVAREGKAELRWLSLGGEQDGRIPVRAGLTATEAVIDHPGQLRDGQPVEVAR